MNIQCDSCQARFHLDERLFRDARAVRVKCRRCGEYIVVARSEEPAAPPVPAEPATSQTIPAQSAQALEPPVEPPAPSYTAPPAVLPEPPAPPPEPVAAAEPEPAAPPAPVAAAETPLPPEPVAAAPPPDSPVTADWFFQSDSAAARPPAPAATPSAPPAPVAVPGVSVPAEPVYSAEVSSPPKPPARHPVAEAESPDMVVITAILEEMVDKLFPRPEPPAKVAQPPAVPPMPPLTAEPTPSPILRATAEPAAPPVSPLSAVPMAPSARLPAPPPGELPPAPQGTTTPPASPMPPLTVAPPAPRLKAGPPGDGGGEKDETEIEFEKFLARLKSSLVNAPPPPAEKKPLRPAPPPPKEDWAASPGQRLRPVPTATPPARTPAAPAAPPAASAREVEEKSPKGGTPFLGNLVLFPSEFKGPSPPAEERQPAEAPPAPPSGVQPELPHMPPPQSAPPPELLRASRVSPSYTVSREVRLDPKTMEENRCVAFFPDSPGIEPYRVLRTRILQAAERKGGNTVMVTSALPREGKTVTAINLALTFSKTYLETALLVDCDLRQQQVHEVLGFDSGLGLGDYLTDGCHVPDMFVWPGVEKLTLISGGKTVSESSEMLGSPAMRALVEEMKARYPNRYLFFDVPPVLTGADALAFAPLVDHILLVVRADETPLPEVQKALGMLPKEKVIGLVLNGQKSL